MTRHGSKADPAVVIDNAGSGGNQAVKDAHELDGVETGGNGGGGGKKADDEDDKKDDKKTSKVRPPAPAPFAAPRLPSWTRWPGFDPASFAILPLFKRLTVLSPLRSRSYLVLASLSSVSPT